MSSRIRSLATLAAVVGASLAACTTERQSIPAPTLTSTTSTSTTVADTVATTETPVETTEVAATVEPTMATTLPSGPAEVLVPLLIGGDEDGWLDLGQWQSDRWQEAFTDEGDPISIGFGAGTPVSVVNLDGERKGEAGDTVEACFDGRTGPQLDLAIPAPEPPGFGYGAIAAGNTDWPLVPRPVAVMATGPESYQALGESIFDQQPVDASSGSVEQVVVADLDGDGDSEALVVFEFIQPSAGPGSPGDFAALFVVDTDTREASTMLENSIDVDLAPDTFPLIERFRVLGVADFNGDGRMEIAVHAWYYEGASVLLYEYDGTSMTEVLANGCGS